MKWLLRKAEAVWIYMRKHKCGYITRGVLVGVENFLFSLSIISPYISCSCFGERLKIQNNLFVK